MWPHLDFRSWMKGADLGVVSLVWEISSALMNECEKEYKELQADIVY